MERSSVGFVGFRLLSLSLSPESRRGASGSMAIAWVDLVMKVDAIERARCQGLTDEPAPDPPVFVRMNEKAREPKLNQPISGNRRSGASESPASNKTFKRRTKPPGQAGLANETRPGLGTRGNEPFPGKPEGDDASQDGKLAKGNVAKHQRSGREPNDKPLPRVPQEQRPDTWAHEAERSTGVSGHSSST